MVRLLIGTRGFAALVAIGLVAGCAGSSGEPATVGAGSPSVVVALRDGTLERVDASGHVVSVLGRVPSGSGEVNAIDVAPDGTVYVSTLSESDDAGVCRPTVYVVRDGKLSLLLRGGAEAVLDPSGTRLAYVRFADKGSDACVRSQLVVRRLADRVETRIPYPRGQRVEGTPPEWPVNWSPDGRKLGVVAGVSSIAVTSIADGRTQIVGGAPDGRSDLKAPVFVDDTTVAGMAGCCVGGGHLVSYSLTTGASHTLFSVVGPVRSIHRARAGAGFWFTIEEQGLWHWDGSTLHQLPVDALITSG